MEACVGYEDIDEDGAGGVGEGWGDVGRGRMRSVFLVFCFGANNNNYLMNSMMNTFLDKSLRETMK